MSEQLGPSSTSSTVEYELYFLIAKFLNTGPCLEAAKALKREIAQHQLLPKRIDWLGNLHANDFDDFSRSNSHIPDNFLPKVCSRIGGILDKEIKPSVSGVKSLLGAGRQSLLRTTSTACNKSKAVKKLLRNHRLIPSPELHSYEHYPPNIVLSLQHRQIHSYNGRCQILPSKFYANYHLLRRTIGHLSSVYCILFDTAGLYIFTGADDNLVKIWSKKDGRLLATLRGHSAEITDMDVNVESTLLASGSCDKIIRLWCLQTTAPVAVLTGHTGMVTSLKFCPSVNCDTRYLASTGNDGCVHFWEYKYSARTFRTRPIKYVERARAGAHMICSAFSPGGTFLVTGSADHHIRIYLLQNNCEPEKIFEIEAHLDRVDSLQFANNSYRFVSGSKDGTAKIWTYETQHWRSFTLQMSTKLESGVEENAHKLQVTMVGWSVDDKYVITAVNTHLLKVWNSMSGQLLYVLKGHESEVFVLESHPTDERVILSAGHDGKVILWDLSSGTCIKVFNNLIDGQGPGAVFDCRFSPDGSVFASTDSHGHISIFGMGSNELYKKCPDQQFFHTDYRPLIRDVNHHVLDEQTQQAPHLMPPPFLVDIDGNPYPPHYQRLVPGREKCNNDQLVPYIAVSADGEAEILQPIRPHETDEQGNPVANQNGANQENANIDEMIEIFQAQNPQFDEQQASGSSSSNNQPSSGESPNQSGSRRDNPVEGVRQSHGNWQSRDRDGEMMAWTKRSVVNKSCGSALKSLIAIITAKNDLEMHHFRTQKKKRPAPQPDHDQGIELLSRRMRKQRQKVKLHNYNVRSRESEGSTQTTSAPSAAVNGTTSRARRTRTSRYAASEYENPDDVRMSSDNSSGSTTQNTAAEATWSSSSSSDSSTAADSDWEEVKITRTRRKHPPKEEKEATRKQPKRGDVDSGDHNYTIKEEAEDSASDSSDEKPIVKKESSAKKASERKKKSESQKPKMKAQLPSGLKELPEAFKPSEWLTDIIPKKTPYQPQTGDVLMYFPQGHKCYFGAVKRVKAYDINLKNQAWNKAKLREQELVKVIAVKYEIKPPRLCCLKLGIMDLASEELTGQCFIVKYHDMPDVIDFLVLYKHYKSAMQCNWKPGDRFRSVIDDAWWSGTIESQEPFEAEYPDSMFQCLNVKWDNGEREKMSPWDLEVIDLNRVPEHLGGGVPVLSSETAAFLYQPSRSEWPPCGCDVECDRLARGLEALMGLAIAEPFNAPVDLNAYPTYAMVVEYPIDLTSIKERIQNRYYRRLESILFDVKFIAANAKLFNEAEAQIVKKAKMVTELLNRFILDSNCEDLMGLYQEMNEEAHNNQASDSSNSHSSATDCSHASTQFTGGHYLRDRRAAKQEKRNALRRKVSVLSWQQQCLNLLNVLFDCEDSTPFRYAVDLDDYPDYDSVIEKPTDLTTIKLSLSNGQYADPIAFGTDVKLIFTNSKNYNTNKKSRVYSMTIRLSTMFDQHYRNILANWKAAVKDQKRRYDLYNRYHINDDSQTVNTPPSRQSSRRAQQSSSTANGNGSSFAFSSESDDDGDNDDNDDSDKNVDDNDDDDDDEGEDKTVIAPSCVTHKTNGNGSMSKSSSGDTSSNSSSSSSSSEESDSTEPKPLPKTRARAVQQNGHAHHSSTSSSRSSSNVGDSSTDDESNHDNKRPTHRKSSSSEDKSDDSENTPKNKNNRSPSNNSSSLDNNVSSSEESDDEQPHETRSKSKTALPRMTRSRTETNHRKAGKRRRTSDSDDSVTERVKVPSKRMRTRNRGKRTVEYQEDSDFEYYGHAAHRHGDDSDNDSDEDDERTAVTSVSSRGRVRKLTALGRSMVH